MIELEIKSEVIGESELLSQLRNHFPDDRVSFEARTVDETRAVDAVVVAALVKVGGDLLVELVKYLLEMAKTHRQKSIELMKQATGQKVTTPVDSSESEIGAALTKANELGANTIFL